MIMMMMMMMMKGQQEIKQRLTDPASTKLRMNHLMII